MVDVNQQIESVSRAVHDRRHEGAPAQAVTLAQTYPSPLAEVWHAMTTAERISRWLTPISGDLRPGGHYQLEGNAGGTVLECEAEHRIRVTWEYAGDVSWVTALLTAEDEQHTRVEVEHLARPSEHWEQYGPGATGIGWDMMLLGLRMHLDGTSLGGPEDAMAWQVSDEGVTFSTSSGQAWCAADIAAGTPEEKARAAAGATIAFYTAVPG